MKITMRAAALLVAIMLLISVFSACSGNSTKPQNEGNTQATATTQSTIQEQSTQVPEELLEYTFYTNRETVPTGASNSNDVVSPEVEKKFNIKIKDIIARGTQMPLEKLNMMVAANNVPDVVETDNPNLAAFYDTGAFADLSQYKDLMINTDKFVSDVGWNMLTVKGQLAALPGGGKIDTDNPDVKKITDTDIFFRPMNNWAMIAREDILKQLGYKFKTVKELQTELDANPRKITDDDVKLDPTINTFEDFNKLLYDIKKLNLKVNGKAVYPLMIQEWGVYHFSVLFSHHGGWMGDPATMSVSGYMTNPGMKEYYKQINQWIKDGIVDKDFLINKPEQIQEKIASGRAAIYMWSPDTNGARESIKKLGADVDVRAIPWPSSVSGGDKPAIDPSYPSGFSNYMVNKNFKDIPRLLKYFDWFNSEEAMDLVAWGPESAGLWEMKDGKKVFKDPALWEAISTQTKTADGKDAAYYGIEDPNNPVLINNNKAWITAPGTFYNYKDAKYSYPAKFDAYADIWNYLSSKMLCSDGTAISAPGAASSEVGAYYWSTARTKFAAKCFFAKSDDEFNKAWDEMINNFKTAVPYDKAVEEVMAAFKTNIGK